MPRPRFTLAPAACAAALSLALGLCSCAAPGDTAVDGVAAPGADPAGAPRMTQQALNAHPRDQLRQGGTLNWAIDQFSTQWNPLHADGSESSTNDVMKALLPTFWRSDAGGTQTPNPAYLKDVRVEVKQGRQQVTWTLNPKAHWSDGSPMTWKDLEATWRAMRGDDDFRTSNTAGFDQVTDVVRGVDDRQAVMTFKAPYSEWQAMFNNAANAPLLPARYAATAEQFNTAYKDRIPLTGGPFRLERLDPQARTVTVAADPDWWGERPLLDKIVFKAIDTAAMPDAFARGDVDFFNNGPSATGYQKIKDTKGGEVRQAGGPNLRQIVLNGRSPQLTDARVRQALFQALDRAEITRTDLAGLDWPYTPMNNHFLVPNQHGYKDNSGGLSRYDPKAAERALDEAGWRRGQNGTRAKDGRELALRFVVPAGNQLAAGESALVTRMLGAIGVKVTVDPVPAGDFFQLHINKYDFDLTAFALLGTPFPATGSVGTFQQGAGGNYAQVGSDALDRALAEAASADTVDQEYDAINRADAEAWQVAGLVPLYQRPAIYGVRRTVANLGAPGLADFVYENIGLVRP
ncbi:ABC transporter family substrate-binding protein [Kitasatospora camelliae]|uniref:ABC transporter family substrate-binding protein n=1 Tax=Kitasatospora camelliae TaxID=3156397 RepID=A0AAU8JXY8_9ACTN